MFKRNPQLNSKNPVANSDQRLVDTHEMPNWIKSLFLQWLPWILRMSRYNVDETFSCMFLLTRP